MNNTFFTNLKGDKTIWAVITIMSVLSFLPLYSASTNLVHVVGNGSTTWHLFKHMLFITLGLLTVFVVHKFPYKFFVDKAFLMCIVSVILLVVTLFSGTVISGANASRWIRIPFIGVTFQPSLFAGVSLMLFTAQYLHKNQGKSISFKGSFFKLWSVVGFILILILPANFSTAAMIFTMVSMLLFVGGYPIMHLLKIIGIGVVFLALFYLVGKAFDTKLSSRVHTWESRIVGFLDTDRPENYQVEKAKIAIATGGYTGKGFGKSVQKNFLSQSTSDFIFAIIVEETGVVGAFIVLFMYFIFSFRILIAVNKATTMLGTLLVIGLGVPIIFQAVLNMFVATSLMPVTGQSLPLISSGGTSVLMTCFSIGVILSVVKETNKVKAKELLKASLITEENE